jgi:hypothetical protein
VLRQPRGGPGRRRARVRLARGDWPRSRRRDCGETRRARPRASPPRSRPGRSRRGSRAAVRPWSMSQRELMEVHPRATPSRLGGTCGAGSLRRFAVLRHRNRAETNQRWPASGLHGSFHRPFEETSMGTPWGRYEGWTTGFEPATRLDHKSADQLDGGRLVTDRVASGCLEPAVVVQDQAPIGPLLRP